MVVSIKRAIALALCVMLYGQTAFAAPYAALVMDARTGKVLHSRNADTRLHPASLTKMMTLYVAFLAIERGEISLDTKVKISRHAASRPPSKLGLRAGQRISMRYLIRATAVKSANDAATAIAEAISGSEPAFAKRMTATAKAMGLTRTTFRNAHGLTANGHLSTARDMAHLGRRLFFDHRDYYNLFSRISTKAGSKRVYNTNARFLNAYRGADGIKTGYTRAAGYNLVGSAVRGNERIIASLFGGRSVAWRNARMAELLDMGFKRAPSRAPVIKPNPIGHVSNETVMAAATRRSPRLPTAISKTLAPLRRPGGQSGTAAPTVDALVSRALVGDEIDAAVRDVILSAGDDTAGKGWRVARPKPRRDYLTAAAKEIAAQSDKPRVVPVEAKGEKTWSVNLGLYPQRKEAERLLLVTALQDLAALDGAYRKIEPTRDKGRRVYRARFVGLTQKNAERACARLQARQTPCIALSPGT